MLDQFYSYLSKKIVEYFNNRELKSGDKFNIQFEKEEEVKSLYDSLKNENSSEEFTYKISDNVTYKTYSVDIKGIKVIVSATIDNITADFLIRLRNMVGDETQEGFKNTAILFIHNTTLDSIIKGTESFQKEGMPFHNKSIVKDIKNQLTYSKLNTEDKYILEFVLEKMNNNMFEDNTSIFQYTDILKVLNKGYVDKKEYNDFGLFYDSNLSQINDTKVIKQRLNENANIFANVDSIHKYGNPEIELEKYFDNKGISKLKEDKSWQCVDYKEVKQSKDAHDTVKPIQFEEIVYKNDVSLWDRPQGNSKAGQRTRNIIIFNKNKLDNIKLEFKFDGYIKKEYIKTDKTVVANAPGKKVEVILHPNKGETYFTKVRYNDDKAKYTFKIAVVECNENVLQSIKTNYTIPSKAKEKFIVINSDEDKITINPGKSTNSQEYIRELNDTANVNEDESVDLIFDVKIEDDTDYVKVDVNYSGSVISLAKEEEKDRPTVATGVRVWKLKREKKESFKYLNNNKIAQGTTEYFAKEDFKQNIEFEKLIIEEGGLYYKLNGDILEKQELDIDDELKSSYNRLIEFYRVNELLPSLAYYDDDLVSISKAYVNKFIEVLNKINNEEVLSKEQRNLAKISKIEKLDGDKEIILTPLHPLNVAYQLLLNEKLEDEEIVEDILKNLNSKYLMPYLYNKESNLYKIVDQNHSPEWTYYVDYKMSRYKGSRDYVSKLTREKIDEFIDHFAYLFKYNKDSKLKMKLINLGDCKEVLIGIYDYYVKAINKKDVDINDLISIDIYIYGDKNIINAFEEISFYESIEDIKNHFGINIKTEQYSEEDIINMFREKVHFYKKDKNEQKYEYSHLTFYEIDQDVYITSSSMEDISTGVSLDGLISGVPSVYLKDTYRTGFGSKFIPEDKNEVLKVAMKMNSVIKSVGTGDPFNESLSVTSSVGEKNKDILNKIYNASHWVTFIDPKVDLNFFKNDVESKDLLIIHYSDQYTSSSGYDAITVTRRSKQYQVIVEEFLKSKKIESNENTVPMVINYFNAVNGDWLLRLISSKSQFPREKLSILSAIKVSLAYLYHPDIIWIPVSLEEILRVSGGAGLNQKDGLFTVKNLTGKSESYSDDLLLIGIQNNDGNVKIHYYPVEVKIGENSESVISKAIIQANHTRNLLDEFLIENEEDANRFIKKIYRNFMMQLAIVSAEKMDLYNIWPEQNWSSIINGDIRTKLINDDYEISNELDEYIGRGSVISFRKDAHFNSGLAMRDDISILELAEQEGYSNIVGSLEEMKNRYINNESDFDVEKMLIRKYKSTNDQVYKEVAVEASKKLQTKVDYTDGENSKDINEEIIREAAEEINTRPIQIMFGTEINSKQPLIWYPTDTEKTMHTNTGIIGTMGTGKTQFTKSLITQLYREQKHNVGGKPIGMLIFDYKGDYIDEEFVNATDAKVYDIFHLPYNPLALLLPDKPKPLLPLHTANTLKETISKAFNLGIKQETLLRDLIMEAYANKGINKANMRTWENPAPTIRDVCSIYLNNEDVKEDSLYAAMKNLDEFEIFEPDTSQTKNLFDIVEGVTVINLSGYDEAIQNLVVAITLDIFYTQMLVVGESKQERGYRQLNKAILVDEADNFLSKNFISIKKILKEGRMFGVGTILSTQLLSHFATSENEYQNYILTWVIHNVSDLSNKDARYIFNTQSKAEEDSIYNKIKSLAKHESLVKIPKENRPIYIRDKAFWELNKQ
ncbi:DNA phosphorothioation-dependent restriction protein DptH [Tepidibacter sp. Z1-5]|uniref:DNA phosphorothioation-dependent restriction protein DptH n=1 Tax=Tepidibacter sp. Z1-5 TaxID=3134138 RepID=UPI0030BD38E9